MQIFSASQALQELLYSKYVQKETKVSKCPGWVIQGTE